MEKAIQLVYSNTIYSINPNYNRNSLIFYKKFCEIIKFSVKLLLTTLLLFTKGNSMYSLLAIAVGICVGCSPLGSSRMLKIIVMTLTGG